MDTACVQRPSPSESEGRIGFLGTFASAAVESAFRQRRFADQRWLSGFLVSAGALRVLLLSLADYQHFGVGGVFWSLLACRLGFLLVSGWALFALRRAAAATAADRLFFGWCLLLGAVTACSLSARPPENTRLLLMSVVPVLICYCVTPLPLPRQAILALTYSAVVFLVARGADGGTLGTMGLVYALSNLFGVVMSWRLNHRRREAFLGALREAELRARLEEAVAEVRTLRGLLCMCAWCKRVRDEAQAWQEVDSFVQSRTHAAFTHGICPDCHRAQIERFAGPLPR